MEKQLRHGIRWSVLAFLTCIFGACNDKFAPPKQAAETSLSYKGVPFSFSDPVDTSLTSAEYIRLGLPANDRKWSGDDMARALAALTTLAKKGNQFLPRYKSDQSEEVFARLTSLQNMDLYRDRTLPLEDRFPQVIEYFQASTQISQLYGSAFSKKEVRGSEVLEFMGAHFHTTVVLFELLDEFLPTLDKTDPSYSVRMESLEQIKRSLAKVVAFSLQAIKERESYRRTERVRFIGYLEETFPLIVPRLSPGTRSDTQVRLEKMQEDASLQDLQPDLGSLHRKVQEALKK